MFEISVIIPTYNESENIIGLIDEVQSQLEGYDYEIIVVDDNSPDGTHLKVKLSTVYVRRAMAFLRLILQKNVKRRCV